MVDQTLKRTLKQFHTTKFCLFKKTTHQTERLIRYRLMNLYYDITNFF